MESILQCQLHTPDFIVETGASPDDVTSVHERMIQNGTFPWGNDM